MVMEDILRAKFEDEGMRARLLGTGDQCLIEGNTWGDTYWGMVRDPLDCEIWIGENWLGVLLMKIRASVYIEENGS